MGECACGCGQWGEELLDGTLQLFASVDDFLASKVTPVTRPMLGDVVYYWAEDAETDGLTAYVATVIATPSLMGEGAQPGKYLLQGCALLLPQSIVWAEYADEARSQCFTLRDGFALY